MATTTTHPDAFPLDADFTLPRRQLLHGRDTSIRGPSYETLSSHFGRLFPRPHFLTSDLGTTAVYELSAASGSSKRAVLIVHGLGTPALGLLPFAKELQSLDPDAHVVLFDVWGHGLSSTPLVAHTPHIFHSQMLQVMGYMQWLKVDLIGYSFGASTAVSFALSNPWMVSSVSVLAPAGLLAWSDFVNEMQDLLQDSGDREQEAITYILDWLEGGPLVMPANWREKLADGEVAGKALREWELNNHAGYPHSVLSIFRNGRVHSSAEMFATFAKLSVEKLGIVGETDPVCSKKQLDDLGFPDVQVIAQEGHGFIRSNARETARIVHCFWTQDA